MKIFNVDNSADSDLKRVVLWQYDLAERFVGWIGILRGFFLYSTQMFWDSIPTKLNISVAESVDEFGLAVWGLVTGVGRPTVTVDGGLRTISSELYRRIIIGRFRLVCSNASLSAYEDFVDFVFRGNVSVVDNGTMSMTFSWIGDATPTTNEAKEMKALIEQRPESVVAYPSGVRDDARSSSMLLGLSADENGAVGQDVLCGGFDEASFCWRYTKEGNWR